MDLFENLIPIFILFKASLRRIILRFRIKILISFSYYKFFTKIKLKYYEISDSVDINKINKPCHN